VTDEALTIPLEVHPRTYIQRLQDRGITAEQIAEALDISVRMVFHMKEKNLEPRWSHALKLVELNALHCSTATSQPYSFQA
jgi:hypothetical protein